MATGVGGGRGAGGLHFSAVGNAVQRVADKPTRTMARALRELEQRFENQETSM